MHQTKSEPYIYIYKLMGGIDQVYVDAKIKHVVSLNQNKKVWARV